MIPIVDLVKILSTSSLIQEVDATKVAVQLTILLTTVNGPVLPVIGFWIMKLLPFIGKSKN